MMNSLVPRSLFSDTPASVSRDFADLWREFDGLFDGFFGSPVSESSHLWWPSLESYEKDGYLDVRMDVPGVDPKDIEVSLTGNVLKITGERKAERDGAKGGYREVQYGRFERTLTVPEGLDPKKIDARYVNGVLELKLALSESAQTRKVPVQIEHRTQGA
jgi:HSP20 family protein